MGQKQGGAGFWIWWPLWELEETPRNLGPAHPKTGLSDWWTQSVGVSAPAKPMDVLPEITG